MPDIQRLSAQLTPEQQRVVSFARDRHESLHVSGLAGTGKTTALMARVAALMREGRRPHEILVLVPQRAAARRYDALFGQLDAPTRGGVEVMTYYALAQRALNLFWPLVAGAAGFAHTDREPVFLTIESTQYFMWRLVKPLIQERGYFGDLTVRRGRLLSQLIDNLNKSALVGFDHTDILARLRGAWVGEADHANAFWQAQDCATAFRAHCLAHNLLDFSLVIELFSRYLLQDPVYQRYFVARYQHLVVDNLEENVPVAQGMIAWAMGRCASTVLASDRGGGFRVFLGADAVGAQRLGAACDHQVPIASLRTTSGPSLAFAGAVIEQLYVGVPHSVARPGGVETRHVVSPPQTADGVPRRPDSVETRHGVSPILDQGATTYWIEMVRWATDRVAALVRDGVAPGDIAIVAPYVSEVMRFAITDELRLRGLDVALLRPSTPFREVPDIRALLTLALLAHPGWEITLLDRPHHPSVEDVSLALGVAIDELDPVRARRLAAVALDRHAHVLMDLAGLPTGGGVADPENVGRLWAYVGYAARQRYETLRQWLDTYRQGAPDSLEVFLMRLFGDLLSRPGYGFFRSPERARAAGRLVESVRKFIDAATVEVGADEEGAPDVVELSRQYVELILGDIASAEYVSDWPPDAGEGVVLAPAYSYLTRDVCSNYQFWIDLGSNGWWHRPNQPLTHPYVLSANWPQGQPWRDVEEQGASREALARILLGLAARCRVGIYLATSDLGIDGAEQTGPLPRAMLPVLAERSGLARGGD